MGRLVACARFELEGASSIWPNAVVRRVFHIEKRQVAFAPGGLVLADASAYWPKFQDIAQCAARGGRCGPIDARLPLIGSLARP